jgi:hypothetical protein
MSKNTDNASPQVAVAYGPADAPTAPKHTEEVRFLVDTSSLRFLLLFAPVASVLLFLGAVANAPEESTTFHLGGAAIFAVPFSIFMLVRIVKAGYLVLDPKRRRLVLSGQSISFAQLSDPQVGAKEVEFTSTQWHPMRGTGEGLQIAPGRVILFNTGHSRRKLQRIADLLEEMLGEYNEKHGSPQRPFP